jgi:hypothetical protein
MKNTFFTLAILLLCNLNNLCAQCTYGYFIDATGFSCDSDDGTICFITNPDINNCQGSYEVQIMFPTGAFIYTDLGDFSLLSNNNGVVTLNSIINFNSDGPSSACLEGVIQVPGTIFNVQAVSLSNPSLILNPSTFTLNNPIVIGSNVGIPSLLQAINNQIILNPTLAATNGQNIVIDGTLKIDENYTFGTSILGGSINKILMKSESSIEILPNKTLEVYRADIFGCEDQWDRIKVNPKAAFIDRYSTIRGAKVAIELLHRSTLKLQSAFITQNDIGIGSFGTQLKSINLNIQGPHPVYGSTISEGIEGFHFENVTALNLNTAFFNIRNMLQNGIFLDKTDLTAKYVTFNNCQWGINAMTPNKLLNVSDCSFENGQVGVSTSGSLLMDINNNKFSELNFGIFRFMAMPNEMTTIQKNYFDATCQYNVVGFIQPSYGDIQNNEMSAVQTNVFLLGLGVGSHKWATQYNPVLLAGVDNVNGYNVSLWNTTDARVFNNVEPVASKYNFFVNGGSNNKIGYNKSVVSYDKNIEFIGSPKGQIYCNNLDGINSIIVQNDCSGTDIRGNEMTGGDKNLVYGSTANAYAYTGTQEYKGNTFDASTEGNPKAINYSSPDIAQLSQFIVGYLAGQQGTEYYPYFTSGFSDWFEKREEKVDYKCPPGYLNEITKEQELTFSIEANIKLIEAGVGEIYGKEIAFDVKLKLFRDLNALQKIVPLNEGFKKWYDELTGTSIATIVALEDLYETPTLLKEDEEFSMQSIAENIRQSASASEVSIFEHNTNSEALTEKPENILILESLMNEQAYQKNVLFDMLSLKQKGLLYNIPAMQELIAHLPEGGENSLQNLKVVWGLLLNRINVDFSGFKSDELNQLSIIANQCVGFGGEGVLIARVLLAESTKELTQYNDECIPTSERGSTPAISQKINIFTIAPNPTNEMTIISIPTNSTSSKLSIIDIFGKEITSLYIPLGQTEVKLSTVNYPVGIYFVKLQGSNHTVKLIVNK